MVGQIEQIPLRVSLLKVRLGRNTRCDWTGIEIIIYNTVFSHLQLDCCFVNSPVLVGTAGSVPAPTGGVRTGVDPAVIAGLDPLHTPGMGV